MPQTALIERMKKQSAGILLYRKTNAGVEVLLAHPGGPFWKKKDDGAWTVPKGEYLENEDSFVAACREFSEETGQPVPDGDKLDLGCIKRKDGKTICVWALEGDFDVATLVSNTFEMEWPPKTGRMESFPEIDRAAWFSLGACEAKLNKGQFVFVERLAEQLGVQIKEDTTQQPAPREPQQTTLL